MVFLWTILNKNKLRTNYENLKFFGTFYDLIVIKVLLTSKNHKNYHDHKKVIASIINPVKNWSSRCKLRTKKFLDMPISQNHMAPQYIILINSMLINLLMVVLTGIRNN